MAAECGEWCWGRWLVGVALVTISAGSGQLRGQSLAEFENATSEEEARQAAASGLDFEVFRAVVEPIFRRDRGGFMPGSAPCVSCHTFQATTPLKLEPLEEEGGRIFWTEAQSRRNFAVVARLVRPGDPDGSRLLNKPLAQDAGGAQEHTGGKFWSSKDDPEWRAIAAWVRAAPLPTSPPPPQPLPDFTFFRQCVQPIFTNPLEDAVGCVACHAGAGPRAFANPPANGSSWTEEESRANYRIAIRFIELGHPQYSRFLYHPLDRAAGGDVMHNGGRRWYSREDPEWQALARWVRGQERGAECPEALRF